MTRDTGDRSLDDRTLGNLVLDTLEGRVEELSALVHQLHADMTAGFQQVRGEMATGLDRVNGRVDQVNGGVDRLHADTTAGFQQVNGRIDRLILATWTIGGGMAEALVGVMVTLIVRGG